MPIIKTLKGSEINVFRQEVVAYISAPNECPPTLYGLIDDCLSEMLSVITFRVCYERFPARSEAGALSLGFASVNSRDLERHLEGCSEIILLAATLGIGPDRLISRYSLIEPSRAVILQATASAVIEAGLDGFCREIAQRHPITERFSCGYGDLPLELQRDIFAALDCERSIGLTLNSSLLMSPTKSVTAIIGIKG